MSAMLTCASNGLSADQWRRSVASIDHRFVPIQPYATNDMSEAFSYRQAFSRNIGWVTTQEQELLRHKRVVIAGVSGVGGVHLLTLVRLGIGNFKFAEFDLFDIANFNCQVAATASTIGKPKVDFLAAMAEDINPEVDIKVFLRVSG